MIGYIRLQAAQNAMPVAPEAFPFREWTGRPSRRTRSDFRLKGNTMNRNRSLDFIKGFLIIFVIITHFGWSDSERSAYCFPFWIDIAVPVFMIISGYAASLSMVKNKVASLEEAYPGKLVAGKLLRYTIPFMIAFAIDLSYRAWVEKAEIRLAPTIQLFLQGGNGPGSYYYPIMLQFVFVFPVIFFLVKRKAKKGLLICFLANAAFEVFKWAYLMNSEYYRLLIFRYLFPIAFGCYLALYPGTIKKREYLISFVVGSGFLILTEYAGYTPRIVYWWSKTSFLAVLYAIPIFALVFLRLAPHWGPVELLGKASYNIFLTQMVYYRYGTRYVYPHISNRILQLTANVVICLAVGVVFYLIENPLTRKLKKRIGA